VERCDITRRRHTHARCLKYYYDACLLLCNFHYLGYSAPLSGHAKGMRGAIKSKNDGNLQFGRLSGLWYGVATHHDSKAQDHIIL
jgi:hypothetical protein